MAFSLKYKLCEDVLLVVFFGTQIPTDTFAVRLNVSCISVKKHKALVQTLANKYVFFYIIGSQMLSYVGGQRTRPLITVLDTKPAQKNVPYVDCFMQVYGLGKVSGQEQQS